MVHKILTVKEILQKTNIRNPKFYSEFSYKEMDLEKVQNYYVLNITKDKNGFYIISPLSVRKGTLKIRRCAYVWASDTTKFDYLRDYYDHYEERKDEEWEYLQLPVFCGLKIFVDLIGNGNSYLLDDRQIRWIDQPNMALMNLKEHTFNNIVLDDRFDKRQSISVYSRNFKSLYADFYDTEEDLGYIRFNFRNNSVCLAITKDKRIYESLSGRYEYHELNRVTVAEKLNIKSKKAKYELYYLLDAILNA